MSAAVAPSDDYQPPSRGFGDWISDGLYQFYANSSWLGKGTEHSREHCLYVNERDRNGEAVEMKRSDLPPKPDNCVRVVYTSDTHDCHRELGVMPPGDIFVYGGDILFVSRWYHESTKARKMKDFNDWLGTHVNCPVVVCIGGNHDDFLESLGKDRVKSVLSNVTHYIENNEVTVGNLRFFGSPASEGRSHNRAFQSEDFRKAAQEASKALHAEVRRGGEPIDVFLSHGPEDKIVDLLAPRVHLWGHVHQLYGVTHRETKSMKGSQMVPQGTLSVNASAMDRTMSPTNPPIVVDILDHESAKTSGDNPRFTIGQPNLIAVPGSGIFKRAASGSDAGGSQETAGSLTGSEATGAGRARKNSLAVRVRKNSQQIL
mmetsp:Transcript_4291/g.9254  ORF Transcript_4291/g.9254 Transcript_4291/m.9254 type:complete len:373 (+) Transcript_4291:232-1350(+)